MKGCESVKSISSFTKKEISKELIDKFEKQLNHIDPKDDGYIILDNNNLVAVVTTDKKDDAVWITAFEIFEPYKGTGLSKSLLDLAVKNLKATKLSVRNTNNVAIHVYEKYGFKKFKKDDYMTYMSITDSVTESVSNLFLSIMNINETIITEASGNTYIVRDTIYPKVEAVLSTPAGDRKYRNLVQKFIDKNSDKLHTPGPVYMIPFTDVDKEEYFELFNVTKEELLKPINEMTKLVNDKASWKLLKQNPIFCLFYNCIRYYTLKRNNTGVNVSLAIYALSVYPSVFSSMFQYGANPDIMQFTIDNLSQKYLIKQAGNLFSTLMISIQNSYKFLRNAFVDASDTEVIRFIARIRNDQKSLLKNVANNYYDNYKKGLRVTTQNEVYGDNEMINDILNNTSVVEDTTRKIVISMITNGVDITRATAAAKISQISMVDLRLYLSKIVTEERTNELQKFIEAILFIYLYQEHHKPNEINEQRFLQFSLELFRRTNTNDVNVVTIKNLLQKWSEDTGVTQRFRRLASQINYKKGIFIYMILCIQYYNS